MRAAYPVDVTIKNALGWKALGVFLWAVAAACLAWALGEHFVGSALAWAPVLILLAGLWGWRTADLKTWRVGWTGGHWYCVNADATADSGAPGELQVMLDLGFWMLLRWRDEGHQQPSCWLPLMRSACPAPVWHALRVAARAHPPGWQHLPRS